MTLSALAVSEDAVDALDDGPLPNPTGLNQRTRGNPCWTRNAAIGDVGGSLDKRDSETEGREPYAATLLRELHAMRGSAYTQEAGTLVDVENVAIARMMSAVWFRTPEKARANETPLRADERIGYHARVLGAPVRPTDPQWRLRERCIALFRAAQGATLPAVETALQDLLVDAFVSLTVSANVFSVTVTHPASMDRAEFQRRVYVEAFMLLDTMIPAWSTFSFTEE